MAFDSILKDTNGNGVPQYFDAAGNPQPLVGAKAPFTQVVDSSGLVTLVQTNPGKVNIVGALPAGSNALGTVDITSLPALPAGTNALGSVTVSSLPALAAGTNAIGSVDVTSLPALAAGTNAIGSVTVTSLPALPAGANTIGSVDVTSLPAIPAGTNAIGSVTVTGLPALPTGTNTIGSIGVTTTVGIKPADLNIDATTKNLNVNVAPSSSLTGALATVVTPGTRVQLPSLACSEVIITARTANTGSVYVGGADVSSTVYGIDLSSKGQITLKVSNTNLIYIDASVANEGISYIAI